LGGRPPPKKKMGGATAFFRFWPQISELPQPIAVKLCHVTGDRWNFKFWCSREKMWGSQNSTKFGAKFSVLRRITFGASGNNVTKVVHMVCRKTGMKNLGTNFSGACTLPIFGRPTWRNFGYFRLRLQISLERIGISTSGQRHYQPQSLPRFAKKIG